MSAGAAPNPSDLACQLAADSYHHLIRTLCLTLPPPPDDTPEALLRRNHAAIARIAALVPANAAEAEMAAQFVAASEQWKECLRLAQLPGTAPEWAAKCRAQAAAMMRQTNSALRLLLRMQEARRKQEADNAACDRLAWTEHCAMRLMAEALSPPPATTIAEPPPAESAPNPATEPAQNPCPDHPPGRQPEVPPSDDTPLRAPEDVNLQARTARRPTPDHPFPEAQAA